MIIGKRNFDKGHTYIMGIMNLTPDSFSDGGSLCTLDSVLDRAEEMIAEGADIIDIGGESTRPGYTQISSEEEIQRIKPAIFAIKQMYDIPVSVDTYKPEVAAAAIEAGADMINDIWGLKWEIINGEKPCGAVTEMAEIIAESGVACCLMHNRREAGCSLDALKKGESASDVAPGKNGFSEAVVSSLGDSGLPIEAIVRRGLEESLEIALRAGIRRDRIVLDPGVGFGKDYGENMAVLKRLDRVRLEDYPMLLGASRKSVVGLTLNLPSNERLEGTLATTAAAVAAGYMFTRVHDVKENYRFIKMFEALRSKE